MIKNDKKFIDIFSYFILIEFYEFSSKVTY